jgi:hypothetical protein
MNTYTWEIESLNCVPNDNIVSCVHWRLKGNDGTNTIEIYGTQSIEYNAETPFIAYEALTKNDAIRWVQEAMGSDKVTQLQETLNSQLEGLANPVAITLPLPWENK